MGEERRVCVYSARGIGQKKKQHPRVDGEEGEKKNDGNGQTKMAVWSVCLREVSAAIFLNLLLPASLVLER